jgi:hypothetical protein
MQNIRCDRQIAAVSRQPPLVASRSSAHLFIVASLLSGETLASLFSTHPPILNGVKESFGGILLNQRSRARTVAWTKTKSPGSCLPASM